MTENAPFGPDFIRISDIQNRDNLMTVFELANEMQQMLDKGTVERTLINRMVTLLFYEPSSRTNSSFAAAAQWLGAFVTNYQNMTYSSVAKGENLPDSIRSFALTTNADAIVLRHPDNNSSQTAAKFVKRVKNTSIINAGSGTGEHPTQALLDAYTIWEHFQTIDNLRIGLVGDLKHGRTVHSLLWLLSQIGESNHISFISAPELSMPQELLQELPKNTSYEEIGTIEEVITNLDVIYMTRTQRERFSDPSVFERLEGSLRLTRELAERMSADSIIMHPLPRNEELRFGVDENLRARYFRQMENGLSVRMALLHLLINNRRPI